MKKIIVLAIVIVAALFAGIKRLELVRAHDPVSFAKTDFASLPAWNDDNHNEALLAFLNSCQEILRRPPNNKDNTASWQAACNAAAKVNPETPEAARIFFEAWFEPYRINDASRPAGLFTGYYLPLLHASLTPDQRYHVPIYGLPNDLVKINLGLFRPTLAGVTIIAREYNHQLLPYPDRLGITQGQIDKTAKILAWADNEIDVFFAQIQGSALLQLPNGERMMISYAGTNGQPYTAIGKVLIEKNALEKKNVSMQTIRQWLEQHPLAVNEVLNRNASYVFFNLSKALIPSGSEQVPLLPMRSLAVDNSVIPLGAPLWLNTPQLQRLMIAQDTGGAIKGGARADVYWGEGNDAALNAGTMQSPGELWILLPRQGTPS